MGERPVGVFDSGVGGISVLLQLRKLMPHERFVYYGDTQNAPYGVREEDDIRDLTWGAVEKLIEMDIKALVIACNTATSAAAESLRAQLRIPVIGIEPALKPAAQSGRGGLILVMATPATLRQKKFLTLYQQYGANARMVPCDGLMEFVERGELDSPALHRYLEERLLGHGDVEAVVLGCTHYVFLRNAVRRVLPNAALYDGNWGTARRLMNLLQERDMLETEGPGDVQLMTSGDARQILPLMERLLRMDTE